MRGGMAVRGLNCELERRCELTLSGPSGSVIRDHMDMGDEGYMSRLWLLTCR